MPASVAGLRFPGTRVLLPRTRLAYIHLRNLLNDAKRDRAARISGYVAIWLPEELVMLYMRKGEVVNATCIDDKFTRALPIAEAIERVPAEPEYGEICFNEAEDDQLACMYQACSRPPISWPSEMRVTDPGALFPYLMATTFDGMLEIIADDTVNYLLFKHGAVHRAFLSTAHHGTVVDRVAKIFAREGRIGGLQIRRWDAPADLPTQAPPALVQAYRDLACALVNRLVADGSGSAPAVAEHARQNLAKEHPALEGFSFSGKPVRDPVTETRSLTHAVALWITEVMWTAGDHGSNAGPLLKELTWERRHMFQSAGLYDKLQWKVM